MRWIWRIFARARREDRGQDLAEYSLLLAFVLLVVLAIVVHVNGGISGIWATADNVMATANTAAGGSTGGDHGDSGRGH
jgi:Flp pilus assembly pilin Flp